MKRLVLVGLMLSLLAGCGGGSSDFVLVPTSTPTAAPTPAPSSTPTPASTASSTPTPMSTGTPSLAQQVAAIVQPHLDKFPKLNLGVVVGVVQPGSHGAISTNIFFFGKLTDPAGAPISLDGGTEFEIGSVTKTFTATVLASLAQVHPSLLDTSANSIFPQTPSFHGAETTIRDLANYTSGLPDSNRGRGSATCSFDFGMIDDCYDLDLMFLHLSDPALSALQFAPGTGYLYSDLAVALLSLAEPVLAGSKTTDPLMLLQEWENQVASLVLQPLAMNSTHTFDPVKDPPLLPKGYRRESGNIVTGLGHNDSWPSFIGAGGLVSTPNDMMVYLEYNLGLLDTPLNSLLPALHTPSTKVTTPAGEQLALGWFIGTLPGSSIPVISKNGGVPAFTT
jgi:serine-type D-Ala-D-Ala carboxypeptidase/endopeptidase